MTTLVTTIANRRIGKTADPLNIEYVKIFERHSKLWNVKKRERDEKKNASNSIRNEFKPFVWGIRNAFQHLLLLDNSNQFESFYVCKGVIFASSILFFFFSFSES